MRIVATSDTHFPFEPERIPDGDVFIHAGDLMYTGYPDEWAPAIKPFGVLQHGTKIFVPGNHDFHIQNYTGSAVHDLSKRRVRMLGTHDAYYTTTLPNGMIVLGLPFVTNLQGWAYNRTEEQLYDLVQEMPPADIVVSHSPPKGVADINDWGVRAWRWYQMIHKPQIWICGHIHEAYGEHAHGGTLFYNVAMCDVNYKQVNAPMVIDV